LAVIWQRNSDSVVHTSRYSRVDSQEMNRGLFSAMPADLWSTGMACLISNGSTDEPKRLSANHPNVSMSLRFESFIARRYLHGAQGQAEGRRFLRLITWVSVGGVAMGVAALVLALAIVRGFSGEIEEKITGFAAHVQVQSIRDEPLDNARALATLLDRQAILTDVSPLIQEFILLRRSARDIDGVSIWGTNKLPDFISSSIVAGSDTFYTSTGDPGVVVGASLARNLGVSPGDRVTAFSVQDAGGGMNQAPAIRQFRVTGVYESSLADFDELYVFAGLEEARSLLGYAADQVSRFDVRVGEEVAFEDAANRLDEILDFPAIARPVTEIYRSLFAWVALQESIIPLIISIIVFVAAVNIVGTLLMIILEKQRDMGILAGMGATAKTRRRIFVRLGLLIGLAGVIIGEVIALIMAWAQLQFGIIPLPAEAYYMSTAPIDLAAMDFVIVALVTLALCVLSSWIPARVAANVNPIQAIRSR